VARHSAAQRKTMLAPNVPPFPGHIARDSGSDSQTVVPLLKGGHLLGVLDLDSPKFNRFDAADRVGLGKLVEVFVEASA
jgi:L-methionine (R)-S-oxide reductase